MSSETIVPADPVKLAIGWLRGSYPWAVTVVKNRPNPTAGRIVTVRRTGGMRPSLVTDAAWLQLECFADTDEDAADVAHHTWGRLFAMARQIVGGVQCYRVQALAGPADFPDGEAQIPRYTMSVQATFRTTAT